MAMEMIRYRQPIMFTQSGDKWFIDVTAPNYLQASAVINHALRNTTSFRKDGKLLYWRDYKSRRGGRWYNAE